MTAVTPAITTTTTGTVVVVVVIRVNAETSVASASYATPQTTNDGYVITVATVAMAASTVVAAVVASLATGRVQALLVPRQSTSISTHTATVHGRLGHGQPANHRTASMITARLSSPGTRCSTRLPPSSLKVLKKSLIYLGCCAKFLPDLKSYTYFTSGVSVVCINSCVYSPCLLVFTFLTALRVFV